MNIKILKTLLYRYNTYKWEVFLSRHEHNKFKLSEWEMRKELRLLRRKGLLTVGKVPCGNRRFANLYNISEELLAFIKEKCRKIRKSFDIVKFNKETSKEDVKSLLWLKGFWKNFRISHDITYNSDYNIITYWDKEKTIHYNLFNGLKKLFWLSNLQLIKELWT